MGIKKLTPEEEQKLGDRIRKIAEKGEVYAEKPTSINKDCKHDYENYIKKGRALFLCPKCNADITLEIVLIAQAKEENDKIGKPKDCNCNGSTTSQGQKAHALWCNIWISKPKEIKCSNEDCTMQTPDKPCKCKCVDCTPPSITSDWEKDFSQLLKNPKSNFSDKERFLIDYIKELVALSRLEGIEEGKGLEALKESYETGYQEGTSSGHQDTVAYLDSDETDFQKAIDEALIQGRREAIEEIIAKLKEHPFTTSEKYNPDMERDYVGIKELLNYLEELKSK